MTKRGKVGRPANPGKVVGFYAPRELLEDLDKALEYTGGTISAFLRDAVTEKTNRAIMEYKGKALQNNTLSKYTGGSIDPQTGN